MNRDEQRARAAGLAPALTWRAGRRVLAPCELSGGTWVGVNETGTSFALINWYSVPSRVAGEAVSRGEVVRTVLPAGTRTAADALLVELELRRVKPFRLLGFFPAESSVIEWRWNCDHLECREHPWRENTWISSGYDEPGAKRRRAGEFRRAWQERNAGGLAWLRRLHGSHGVEPGPYSHCMHREDAATVSYTEIAVGSEGATMRYAPGSPCCRREPWVVTPLGRALPGASAVGNPSVTFPGLPGPIGDVSLQPRDGEHPCGTDGAHGNGRPGGGEGAGGDGVRAVPGPRPAGAG